ncbi:MAG: pseudaminic acid synthase [Opitutales bacterium]
MSLPIPLDSGRVCVIAEISANHNQDENRAIELVNAAIDSGADAVKIQTYTADTLTLKSDRPEFRIAQESLWQGRTLHDLYQEAYTPWEWQERMMQASEARGRPLFSSPFDPSSVEFLENLNTPGYKIASPEIIDKELIQLCAATGKPLIMSTGMASLEEIEEAVTWAKEAGATDISLLKCTSAYPAKAAEMNLRSIDLIASKFKLRVGLSDHTLGDTVAIAAVALGAQIVEKHFTLSRSDGGPDAAFSMEPAEFKRMVERIRETEASLGEAAWISSPREIENRTFRRSLYWVRELSPGDIIQREDIQSVRPANGLPPKYLNDVIGKRTTRAISINTPVEEGDFS